MCIGGKGHLPPRRLQIKGDFTEEEERRTCILGPAEKSAMCQLM